MTKSNISHLIILCLISVCAVHAQSSGSIQYDTAASNQWEVWQRFSVKDPQEYMYLTFGYLGVKDTVREEPVDTSESIVVNSANGYQVFVRHTAIHALIYYWKIYQQECYADSSLGQTVYSSVDGKLTEHNVWHHLEPDLTGFMEWLEWHERKRR